MKLFFYPPLIALSLILAFQVLPAPLVHAATPSVQAASTFEYSGWLPYWRVGSSTRDVLPNVSKLAEVNPFGYTVKKDGALNDAAQISKSEWQTLFAAAKKQGVRVVPTIMWSDTEAIHTVLSSKKLRKAHVAAIVKMVETNGFDGVDIDYEGKRASSSKHYSTFLKELSVALKKSGSGKMLMCTIEARTPPQDLYKTIPADLEYANDFKAINKYCDRVRLMTYDQQRADLTLNAAAGKELYAPVADVAWVRKVANLALKDIDKSKLVLGVPTYGYIYQVMPYSDGSGYSYILLEAFNPKYGTDTAREYGITPKRNSAGELSFTYVPKSMPKTLPTNAVLSAKAPKGTHSSLMAALGATALAKEKGKQSPFYMLSWSDATAIESKVKLAKELGLRGIAVFKLDGGQDPQLWSVLK